MDLTKKIHVLRKSVSSVGRPRSHPTHSPSSFLNPTYLENDHKSNIEFFDGSKKAQREEIQHLKEEIRKLPTQLLKKVPLVISVLACHTASHAPRHSVGSLEVLMISSSNLMTRIVGKDNHPQGGQQIHSRVPACRGLAGSQRRERSQGAGHAGGNVS